MTIRSTIVSGALAALGLIALPLVGLGAEQSGTQIAANTSRTAPDFAGVTKWLNSAPLNIADLRGKVVLVDFWTYGCINCAHTLPHVTKLYDTYKDKGLVVVGVHAPEFPFEKSTSNVEAALKRFGIKYPVAQDNDFATWNAYHNQYWPAQYIVDPNGKIVFEHAGEGQYDEIERTIKNLLSTSS